MSDSPIKVTNRRWDSQRKPEHDDVVIDISRPNPLGNPYQLHRETGFGNLAERTRVIELYRQHLHREFDNGSGLVFKELERIVGLIKSGKTIALNCWCAPLPCHGEAIEEFVVKLLENEFLHE